MSKFYKQTLSYSVCILIHIVTVYSVDCLQGRSSLQALQARAYTFVFKMPKNAAAVIDICVIYRPDQPDLSAQIDPADTFRLRGIDVQVDGRFGQRMFWPGRFVLGLFGLDLLASQILQIGYVGQITISPTITLLI